MSARDVQYDLSGLERDPADELACMLARRPAGPHGALARQEAHPPMASLTLVPAGGSLWETASNASPGWPPAISPPSTSSSGTCGSRARQRTPPRHGLQPVSKPIDPARAADAGTLEDCRQTRARIVSRELFRSAVTAADKDRTWRGHDVTGAYERDS
jgi:hypothetical protein